MENINMDVVKKFLEGLFSSPASSSDILADNLQVEDFFPHRSSKKAFLRAMQQTMNAMKDVKYELNTLKISNDMVVAGFQVRGVHERPLDFSFMKLPVLPPTNKSVSWPAMQWGFTLTDGKIVSLKNLSSMNNGMPGILKSFGLKSPSAHNLGALLKSILPSAGAGASPKRFLRFMPLIPLTVILVNILFVASPIDAVAWTPHNTPLEQNEELTLKGEMLGITQFKHAEDLAFDENGQIYAGSDDGNIYRIVLDDSGQAPQSEVFSTTGGFPLGMQFDDAGNLIVAVKEVGLMSIASDGKSTLLTDEVNGTPITYANAVAINSNGLIYFTDSSTKFDRGWPYDVLEARPHGRLLSYDPNSGQTSLVLDELYFANGLILSPDESYLLINESTRTRISRYWLKGSNAGELEVFADNLPILPDNISMDENGNYLLGGMRRLPMMDKLQPNAWLKEQIAKLPIKMLNRIPTMKNNRYGMVLILDENGNIKESLQDPTGKIYAVSSAREHDGFIYISTLLGEDIARYPYHSE